MIQTSLVFRREKGLNAPKLVITCSRANFTGAGFASEPRRTDVCCSDTSMVGQIPTESDLVEFDLQNAA